MATRRELLLGAGAGAVGLALGGVAASPGVLGGSGGPLAGVVPRTWRSARPPAAPRTLRSAGARRLAARHLVHGAGGPYAAITFDDGPTPQFTPRILDALATAGVHATFYVMATTPSGTPI